MPVKASEEKISYNENIAVRYTGFSKPTTGSALACSEVIQGSVFPSTHDPIKLATIFYR